MTGRRSFLFFCATAIRSLAQPGPQRELAAKLQPLIDQFQGKVWLFAKNLDSGATFGIREDEKVRTASTIKLPILCALADLVAAGKVRWEEPLTLTADDKVSGSGVVRELSNGIKLPIRDHANLMIVVSDNTSTNLILDRITADAVNDYMDKLGLPATRVMRKIRGDGNNLKPVETGHSRAGKLEENRRFGIGSSTSREMVMLLEKLERGQVVSPDASKDILATLRRQQYKDGIGRHISFPVASKSGSLDRLRSDVGIVYAKAGRIAMAITVDDMPVTDYSEDNAGLKLISDLAQMLVGSLAR